MVLVRLSLVDSNLRLILIILEHSSTTESRRTSLVLGSDEEKHSEADSGQTDERVEVTGRDSVRPFVHCTGRSIFLLWSLSCLFKLDSQLCYQENGSQEKQVGKKDPIDLFLLTKLKVFLLEYEYLTIAEYLNLNNEH